MKSGEWPQFRQIWPHIRAKWPQLSRIWPQQPRKWPHIPEFSSRTLIKAVLKCIGRDRWSEFCFDRDETKLKSSNSEIKSFSSLPKTPYPWITVEIKAAIDLAKLRHCNKKPFNYKKWRMHRLLRYIRHFYSYYYIFAFAALYASA